ncbi:hypothetical protein HKX48_003764 [Thoreauomyces humboldtii]|nr:hypothetical protein HKX48_003764 [Thoreauomyces humboldtii]
MTFIQQNVLIVGGGIGGLALAQGLKKAGIAFRLFERDPSLSYRAQGYRIRIGADGAAALHALLPSSTWNLFEKTSAATVLGFTGLDTATGSIDLHARRPPPPVQKTQEHQIHTADRTTLRATLATGLDDHITFDRIFTRFELVDGGGVRVHFRSKDGDVSHEDGTILVAADGVHSRVREQFLTDSHSRILDTTGRVLFGKTPLTPELEAAFSKDAQKCMSLAKDQRPVALFLEPVRFSQGDPHTFADHVPSQRDYVYWVLGCLSRHLDMSDEAFSALSRVQAKTLAVRLVKDWHPSLQVLVTSAPDDTVAPLVVSSVGPVIDAWTTNPAVTLLGDAIHPMPPTAGSGANTALGDAALLTEALRKGGREADIAAYENEMREVAKTAIEGSFAGGGKIFGLPPWNECKPVVSRTRLS